MANLLNTLLEKVQEHLLLFALLCFVAYLVGLSIYNLYFHPLAKFPGDKLAALSTYYAGYHDLVRGGQYVWVVEEMHRKYGPIVRVRPDTLHCNDPHFMDEIYSQSPKRRRERCKTVTKGLQAPGSMLATEDHAFHRQRRSVLHPYFSQQNVRRLEPTINDTLAALLNRMAGWAKSDVPIHMSVPFRAATKDVIQAYCFGEGKKYIEMPDCNAAFFDVITPQRICHLGTYVFPIAYTMANLPASISIALVPRVGVFARFMEGIANEIEQIKAAKEHTEGRTIFHEIIRSDMPESEKQTRRLVDEAMIMLVAGSETTASTLVAIMYHLLSDNRLLQRLKNELEAAMPDPNQLPVASALDGLVLLNAIIQEALRLYPGATHRQDRSCPDEDLLYQYPDGRQVVIPRGTGIGMTAPLINRHSDLYDRPNDFLPDRYIENPGLRKYTMSFSKGGRQCIGINLAYQELQTFTAGIFRRYSIYDSSKAVQNGPTLELIDTKREDIAMSADYITPAPYEGSHGLRVRIRQ